mgnify:CR=1 FL=1
MIFDVVLFDFGGTLDGPGDYWLDRFAACYHDCNVDVPRSQLAAAFAHATRRSYADAEMRHRYLESTVACHVAWQDEVLGRNDRAAAAAITAAFVERTRANLAATRPWLERWQARTRLGVVSNFYGNVHLLLDEAGFTPLLTTIVDSTAVDVAKPDPRIFAIALERVGVAPERSLYVGDSFEKDVLGARSAGIRTAWLPGPGEPRRTDASADFVLERFADLDRVIE